MKRIRWIVWAILILSGLGLVFAAVLAFDRAKGQVVIRGIRQLRRGHADAVSLSAQATRILTRNDAEAEAAFRHRMGQKGWEYVCHYGRSALYRSGQQEVLARKKPIMGGFCIYELMDESYFRHVKQEAGEVA